MNLIIPLSPKKIIKFLLVIICILTSLSLSTEIISKFLENSIFEFFSDIFNLGTERNIPTLFSVLILWLASFLCALITFIKKEKGDRYTIHWGFLAVIFLLLGWDEGVQLHDALTDTALATNLSSIAGIKKHGIFTFNWVVIAIPIVFLLGLSYLKFVWSFPVKQRKLLIIAAITYVMGALGMEMISALIFDTIGSKQLIYMFTSTSEDVLEMSGVVIFIYFLLLHLGLYIDQITINFIKGDEPFRSAHLVDEKIQNIDQLLASTGMDTIDLLKVDIEGSEIEVFGKNSEKWLKNVKNLAIELHGSDCEKTFFAALSNYDYELLYVGELVICKNLKPKDSEAKILQK